MYSATRVLKEFDRSRIVYCVHTRTRRSSRLIQAKTRYYTCPKKQQEYCVVYTLQSMGNILAFHNVTKNQDE